MCAWRSRRRPWQMSYSYDQLTYSRSLFVLATPFLQKGHKRLPLSLTFQACTRIRRDSLSIFRIVSVVTSCLRQDWSSKWWSARSPPRWRRTQWHLKLRPDSIALRRDFCFASHLLCCLRLTLISNAYTKLASHSISWMSLCADACPASKKILRLFSGLC